MFNPPKQRISQYFCVAAPLLMIGVLAFIIMYDDVDFQRSNSSLNVVGFIDDLYSQRDDPLALHLDAEKRADALQQAVLERTRRNGFAGAELNAVSEADAVLAVPLLSRHCDALGSEKNAKLSSSSNSGASSPEQVFRLYENLMRLTYGELPAADIVKVLTVALQLDSPAGAGTASQTLVDVGCGRGKVVALACATMAFRECLGVDVVAERVKAGRAKLQELARFLTTNATHGTNDFERRVQLHVGDATQLTEAERFLPQATIVYMYNTAFGNDLNQQLCDILASTLTVGTRVIVHSLTMAWQQAIEKNAFQLTKSFAASELTWTKMYMLTKVQ